MTSNPTYSDLCHQRHVQYIYNTDTRVYDYHFPFALSEGTGIKAKHVR